MRKRNTLTAPGTKESRTYGVMPYDLDTTRREMMAAAGFTPDLLVKAREKLEQALEARKKHYTSHMGHIVDERDDPDFLAILRATQQLLKLYQLLDGGNRATTPRPVTVQVAIAPWAQGKRRRYSGAIEVEGEIDK